jgi:tetratricopeptide (TPR) repeat protein
MMLKQIFFTFCFIAMMAHSIRADHEDFISSYTMETADKKYLFVMLKAGTPSKPLGPFQDEKYPQSGLYLNDGSSTPLWTVDWCANVLLPADGIHLIRRGRHTLPIEYNEEVITFFAYGKELKSYRVSDLVQFPRLLPATSNYYEWQKLISVEKGATPFIINLTESEKFPYNAGVIFDEAAHTMRLETNQGDSYLFDFNTGEMISSHRPVRSVFLTLVISCLLLYFFYLFRVTGKAQKRFTRTLLITGFSAFMVGFLIAVTEIIFGDTFAEWASNYENSSFLGNFFYTLFFYFPYKTIDSFCREVLSGLYFYAVDYVAKIFCFWFSVSFIIGLLNYGLVSFVRLFRNRLFKNMKTAATAFLLITVLFMPTTLALAQQGTHDHQGAVDSIPLELLNKPVTLREGAGKVSDPVTTSSKEAQAFYNQGIAYLHSYVWIEAARSFNQALRLDAKFAMAYAGLCRAYTGLNLSAATREALEKAQTLTTNVTPRERRRIMIHFKQLDALADIFNSEKQLAYKKALDDALIADTSDVELLLLRGNAEEGNPAAGRGQRGLEGALVFYQRALALAPNHLGAHHYLTHTYENLGRIEEALKHGEMCAKLAPSVPHEIHMYGHNLRRVGRIKEAIEQFEKADTVQRAYFKSENIPAEYDWHYQHNLDLLSTSYQYQGQMKKAEEIMRQAFNIPSLIEAESYNRKAWLAFLIARGRPDEALEAAATLKKSKWEIVRAIGFIMASHALMSQKKLPEASNEAKAALNELQLAGRKASFVSTDMSVLQGEFFLRTGQQEKGRLLLQQAMTKMRAERGPDNWTQALFQLEAIAKIAREINDWDLAATATAQLQEHDANYAGTHFSLALLAEQKGDKTTALAEFKLAEKLWSDADKDLPELLQIKERLTKP